MPSNEFGTLLQTLLDNAGKKQNQIAEKIAEKKGRSPEAEESRMSRYISGTNSPGKPSTVYNQMNALLDALITEHVVTSEDQANELISRIPFKYTPDENEKRIIDSVRATLRS